MSGSGHIPRVTVLLPVYNAALFLQATMDSILDQRFCDFEVLAMDDGSTDGSLTILRSFTDPRLRVIAHERNMGLIAALNEGIEAARGTYIARMDADDVMHPDRLAQQVAHLDAHPELAVLATCVEPINADGEVTGKWNVDQDTLDEQVIRAMMPRTNCIAHPSVMIRRSALADLRYSPAQKGAEDWDLWLRMLSRGLRIAKLPTPLLQYRVHAGSIMGSAKKERPYELRLLQARSRFLWSEWRKWRVNGMQWLVVKAQVRTMARHLRSNVILPLLRDLKRLLTYSPFALWREHQILTAAVNEWKGEHIFFFPYLSTGGAEQVHADILESVCDRNPLVVICGRSNDRAFAKRYAQNGSLVEIPRLLHHPFTRNKAILRLARLINAQERAVLFSSLTGTFFDVLPLLRPGVRTFHMQHAFLYQPDGNLQHRQWLRHFDRVSGYVFVSGQAMGEFEKFLFANHVPRSRFGRLHWIPNAVHAFGKVVPHERIGLLFVGRSSPEKRLPLFLALTSRLEREHAGRFRYTVVGTGSLEGYSHVEFMGTVNDREQMARIYGDNDLLALTSDREGFPMVIMEAMAQGLAVLATPVGDVPARLDSGHAVITSSVQFSVVLEELAAAVIALDGDRTRLLSMRNAALAKAMSEFDMDRFRANYRSLLSAPTS